MNCSIQTKECFLFILLLLFNAAKAQEEQTRTAFGSAKDFKGKILVVNCFVSSNKKDWSEDEKKNVLTKETQSLAWAQEQVSQWKIAALSFITSNIGFEKDIKLDEIKSSTNTGSNSRHKVAWVPLVLHAAGYALVKDFYDSVKKANQADNVVVMIFAKEKGHSFAEPSHNDNVNKERFLEGVIVYKTNDYDDSEMRAGTIIHEMLHLFGAWDMYGSGKKSIAIKTGITNAYAPRTIMLGHAIIPFHLLSYMDIDPLTAWRIGWSTQYLAWFQLFGPKKTAQQETVSDAAEDEPEK